MQSAAKDNFNLSIFFPTWSPVVYRAPSSRSQMQRNHYSVTVELKGQLALGTSGPEPPECLGCLNDDSLILETETCLGKQTTT